MTLHEQKSNNNSNQKMNQSNSNDNSVPAKSPDFFQVITLFKKKANFKLHATSRTKMRNYISNILYAGVTKEDFYNRNIVFDIYVLLTKKLNPFS